MLERDVNNMRNYYGMYAPELLKTRYAKEMWALFEDGKLTPESELTGLFEESTEAIDIDAVLHEIESAEEEALARQARMKAEQEDSY
jgi:RIO kinase 1